MAFAPQRRSGPPPLVYFGILLVVLLFSARSLASFYIDYQWWREVGQLQTWTTMLLYGTLPVIAAVLIAFAILWAVHARALKFAGASLRQHPYYRRITTLALLVLAIVVSSANIQSSTVVRYLGSRAAGASPETWRDPVFARDLSFYFFHLPFYSELTGYILALAVFGTLIFLAAAKFWELSPRFRDLQENRIDLELSDLFVTGAASSLLVRALLITALLAFIVRLYLGRFALLLKDHGFLVGMDYVDERVTLPLQWALIGSCVIAAVFVFLRRPKWLLLPVAAYALQGVVPAIVGAVYVKPNELSLQRPYIERHLEATRHGFSLDRRVNAMQYPAQLEAPINTAQHRSQLENVRLWDWRAFHDTITQIQALRQYYVFRDTDVDRYNLNGRPTQVMLSPREIEIRQLSEASANWINTHLVYTHGYGVVMADANKIEPSGYPVMYIQDAPPKINTPGLQLTRPEIYFGEQEHEPIFVRTNQPEFNYPSGSENVHTRYEGSGGIPISVPFMRVAAALAEGDWNILLTSYLTGESRMIVNRNVVRRVEKLAPFMDWDEDPYMVLDQSGRLIWMIDGYTSSTRHPYSRAVRLDARNRPNYMRNSIKATVDAYNGSVTMYVFDESDPIIRAWRTILPALFKSHADMPQDLRAHARYPETFFKAQAESYRTYHMTNPESFYNLEDVWSIARRAGQGEQAAYLQPTYMIMQLPGEAAPEYVLTQAFTPRNKDNLIGLMVARSDGEKLGDIVVLQLSKQSLIYGPLQVESRINSDEIIAKDLTLWNQQGSQVLRGQMLILPIENTFLYVMPIYIQAQQAAMPQLKKVVLAMGNRIIYRDSYAEALAELSSGGDAPPPSQAPSAAQPPTTTTTTSPPAPAAAPAASDTRLSEVRNRLRRYRELASQGRWSEAGRELEAIEALVGRQ